MGKFKLLILAIFFILFGIFLYFEHKKQMTVPYSLCAVVLFSNVKSYLDTGPPHSIELPEELPNQISGQLISQSTGRYTRQLITLADPFNSSWLGEGALLKGIGSTYDGQFSYRGRKIGYYKISKQEAIIFSYGPDRDNDIGNMPIEDLNVSAITQVIYDATNGTISNGDIIQFINMAP